MIDPKMNLAQLSAASTASPQPPDGMPPGGAPPSGPPAADPGDAGAGGDTGDLGAALESILGPQKRPVVAAHKGKSVGTHGSRSPKKRANATHGMTK